MNEKGGIILWVGLLVLILLPESFFERLPETARISVYILLSVWVIFSGLIIIDWVKRGLKRL